MGKTNIIAPRGMYDLLPDDIRRWRYLEDTGRELFQRYGYREIRTPLVEETQLFARGIGESTDIVTKEMYTFPDRKGRSLTLRPEGTASIVRAYVEHKLYTQRPFAKFYYVGPMFRYERPQAGRNRQFFQMGAEAIGSASPLVDFEIIHLAYSFFAILNFKEFSLILNSLGCSKDRPRFAEALRSYYADKGPMLCDDCRKRLDRSPLRLLDCGMENCKKLAVAAPTTQQYLCLECAQHFETLQSLLEEAKVKYQLDRHLVRGLDYYTRTVFEIQHPALGARSAICGGGRYDNLVEEIGGPPTPAAGFSIGIEATLLAMEKENIEVPPQPQPDAFICSVGEQAVRKAVLMAIQLREAGFFIELDFEGRSLKAQMKLANKLAARFAIILAEKELAEHSARLKDMSSGEESVVPLREVANKISKAQQH
ncbi:MAG: histidine--tRNA ligase [Candidatus Abyssubacteria bacterium]